MIWPLQSKWGKYISSRVPLQTSKLSLLYLLTSSVRHRPSFLIPQISVLCYSSPHQSHWSFNIIYQSSLQSSSTPSSGLGLPLAYFFITLLIHLSQGVFILMVYVYYFCLLLNILVSYLSILVWDLTSVLPLPVQFLWAFLLSNFRGLSSIGSTGNTHWLQLILILEKCIGS